MRSLANRDRCAYLFSFIVVGLSAACDTQTEEGTNAYEERVSPPDAITSTDSVEVDNTLLRAVAVFQSIRGKTPRSDERSFEIINDDQRFGEVLAAIGTPENGGPLRSGDGSVWHPTVDFDRHVVGWVYLGWYASCRDKVVAASSAESEDGQHLVEVTVGAEGCAALASECYQLAFLELPRTEGTYDVEYKYEPPHCP